MKKSKAPFGESKQSRRIALREKNVRKKRKKDARLFFRGDKASLI
jgi:hypothetical protein